MYYARRHRHKTEIKMSEAPRSWYLRWLAYCDHKEDDYGFAQEGQHFHILLKSNGTPDRRANPWYKGRNP